MFLAQCPSNLGAFKFPELLNKLEENDVLWSVVKHLAGKDLSDVTLGETPMGDLFEKLMYRCFSGNGQVAVELYAPRDAICMMVDVLLNSGDDGLRSKASAGTVYETSMPRRIQPRPNLVLAAWLVHRGGH